MPVVSCLSLTFSIVGAPQVLPHHFHNLKVPKREIFDRSDFPRYVSINVMRTSQDDVQPGTRCCTVNFCMGSNGVLERSLRF
jgi:hypothetical protein